MKNLKRYLVASVLSIFLLSFSTSNVKAQVGVSFSVFYDNLAPYGNWISDPHYGYVWAPNVGVGFRPYYSSGYWVMTDYGNTWVSTYPWGWAPFHYGRWVYDGYYGWLWVPDNVWGPAWVSWRGGGDYYGWAPLAPGISISVSFGTGYYVPNDYWVFVPQRYVLSPDFQRYYVGPRTSTTIINQTTIINNTASREGTTYIAGPRTQDIQRASGQQVTTHSIRDGGQAKANVVSGSAVQMYRPQVTRSADVAPSRVEKGKRAVTTKPQPLSTNGGKPERLSKSEQSQQGGAAGSGNGARPQQNTQQQRQQQAQPQQEQARPNNQPKQNNERPSNSRKEEPAVRPQQSQPERQVAPEQPRKQEQPAARPEKSQPQQRQQQARPEPQPQPRQEQRGQPQQQQPQQQPPQQRSQPQPPPRESRPQQVQPQQRPPKQQEQRQPQQQRPPKEQSPQEKKGPK